MIVTHGKIYTVDESQSVVEAVAIKDGVFLAVGDSASIEAHKGPDTEVIDLGGGFAMPGLIDTHIHPDSDADNRVNINVSFDDDWETVAATLQAFKEENPDRMWLHGGTLNWLKDRGEPIVDTGVASHKSVLDEIVDDRAVALYDQGYHAMLVNSKALELAGIDRDTEPPEGGIIVRDENGEPTDVLRETAADLIFAVMELPREEHWYENGLKAALKSYTEFGITALTDAYGSSYTTKGYIDLEKEAGLNQWVQICTSSPVDKGDEAGKKAQAELIEQSAANTTEQVKLDCVKYILDGSASGMTAVMLDPFLDTDFRGDYRDDIEEVEAEAATHDRNGLAVKAHAIGDRSIREMLDVFERFRETNPDGPRHTISHGTFVNLDDASRFKELNVMYEASPALWFPNSGVDVIIEEMGEERAFSVWPIKSLVEAGAHLTYGSDWPVSLTPNPWIAMETMFTRQIPGGSEDSLNGDNAIDLATAIEIFTINGAYQLSRDDRIGSIATDKSADMIVLDRDLFEIPATDIHQTNVLRTIFRGETIHQAGN